MKSIGGNTDLILKTKSRVKNEIKEEVNVPNTGDNIVLYVLVAIVSLIGIVISKKVNTKKIKINI